MVQLSLVQWLPVVLVVHVDLVVLVDLLQDLQVLLLPMHLYQLHQ